MTSNNLPLIELSSKFVSIKDEDNDYSVHYQDIGSGTETVVLLHGSGPGASAWSNYSQNVKSIVEAGFRVILLDFPGWGKSDPFVCTASRSEFNGRCLRAFIEELKIKKIHIIGNSMGAHSAVAFALANPGRAEKLVLMGGGTAGPSLFTPMMTEGIKLLQNLYKEPTIESLKAMMAAFVYDQSSLDDEVFRTRLDNMLAQREHLDNFVTSIDVNPRQFSDYSSRLGEIESQTLVIWGRDDRFVPMDTGLRLIAGIRNSELHIFNQCGHWVQWEHARRFNQLVTEFLSSD